MSLIHAAHRAHGFLFDMRDFRIDMLEYFFCGHDFSFGFWRRYLFFLILTIIFATVKSDNLSSGGRVAAVVVCLIFQVLALAWYVLSYIPFGRDLVKKCFGC